MSSTLLLLLLAAFLVAFFHAILPDHWMPIAILARTQRWPMRRALRVAAWAGFGHIAGSLVLGAILLVLGYGLEGNFAHFARYQDQILGGILLVTGTGLLLWQLLRGAPHPHEHHEHDHVGHASSKGSWVTLMITGVAASPDGAFVPVLLAALPLGTLAITAVLLTYSLATLALILFLVWLATWLGFRWRWDWLDRNGERLSPAILVILGFILLIGF
ncbi:manganese efflux pump [Acidithiobacillus sp.]|uniref:manganese efflux pump n=1 Tax=Acidithiobacillus sp. TaxID=1872118 RepID=UPI0032B01A7E